MKIIKYLILTITILLTANIFSQQFPKNAKPGDCFIRCKDEISKTKNTEWIIIDCNLKKDSIKLKQFIINIQNKLINKGFNDIKPTGKLDYKTSYYYNNLKKLIRKRKRIKKHHKTK